MDQYKCSLDAISKGTFKHQIPSSTYLSFVEYERIIHLSARYFRDQTEQVYHFRVVALRPLHLNFPFHVHQYMSLEGIAGDCQMGSIWYAENL